MVFGMIMSLQKAVNKSFEKRINKPPFAIGAYL